MNAEIEAKTEKITGGIYKTYGTSSGVLFGIENRAITKSIIKYTLERTMLHLCKTCEFHPVECKSTEIKCGEGIGNDNIIECDGYEELI